MHNIGADAFHSGNFLRKMSAISKKSLYLHDPELVEKLCMTCERSVRSSYTFRLLPHGQCARIHPVFRCATWSCKSDWPRGNPWGTEGSFPRQHELQSEKL